ncbi:hypothetical protein Gorai_024109 [Gossypium raimondii]|uniref:Uncharacterized protein n=1 Tax=Gossypium raimondii TaxID=29730 RepID=A0A7J8NY54_GOSRA|nr:hypothetical protein [Gossypium raimondii]
MIGSTFSGVSSIQKVGESHPLPPCSHRVCRFVCSKQYSLNPLRLLLRQIPFLLQRQPLGDMHMLLQLSDLGRF